MSQPPAARSESPEKPAWKALAEDQFVARRQRPSDARRNHERLNQKLSAIVPARLPTLPLRNADVSDLKRSIRLDQTHFEQKDELPVRVQPVPPMKKPSTSPIRRPAFVSTHSEAKSSATAPVDTVTSTDLGYSIPPPDLEQLYKEHRSANDTLPLELFDDDDTDPSPEYWLSLSTSKYEGRGTAARSQLFVNKEYIWLVVTDVA